MPVVRAARRALPAALLLCLGLVLPAGAHAAAMLSVGGSALTFTTSDGLDHQTQPYLAANGHLRIEDLGGIAPGTSGCTSVSAGVVECGAPSAFTRLVFSFGAGSDTVAVGDGLHLAVTVDGGAGNDAVGAWDETADAAPVTCGSGVDTVDYDVGLDTIGSDCETLPPHIEGPVVISGQPTVGEVLTRSTPATSGGMPTAWYTYWERCDAAYWQCEDIPGAEDPSYRLTAEDRGSRIQVAVYAGNSAGYDGVLSDPTALIGVPDPPSEPRAFGPPPATTLPLPAPAPNAFSVAGPPALAVRGATATVDTGRSVACPAGGPACRLSATARPAGASAKVHGRPRIAGTAQIRLRPGASAKLAIRLTPKAARLLRSKGRITLAVSAVLERGAARHAASSFAVTVKAPKRGH
ncbi:MAG TPA: hypothetical protein VF080_09450 [Solirubrobacteraceae bacterium]